MEYKEKYDTKIEKISATFHDIRTECYRKNVQGILHDEILNIDTGEKIVIDDHNLIVVGFSKLISALLKQQSGYVGLQYWGVGSGEGSSWDILSVEQRAAKVTESKTQLYNEVARVPISMAFLDESDNPTINITTKLRIQATFGIGISGYLREFGIFGGNATTSLNSGFMIDMVAHSLISLNVDSSNMILSRTLYLTL